MLFNNRNSAAYGGYGPVGPAFTTTGKSAMSKVPDERDTATSWCRLKCTSFGHWSSLLRTCLFFFLLCAVQYQLRGVRMIATIKPNGLIISFLGVCLHISRSYDRGINNLRWEEPLYEHWPSQELPESATTSQKRYELSQKLRTREQATMSHALRESATMSHELRVSNYANHELRVRNYASQQVRVGWGGVGWGQLIAPLRDLHLHFMPRCLIFTSTDGVGLGRVGWG